MTLSANNISCTAGQAELVHGVSTVYSSGEFTAILGANGAGKSTLLRCFAGLLKPSTGSILIDGESPISLGPLALARKRAYLPQEHELGFPFSVLDVVMLGRSPHFGLATPAEDEKTVSAALQTCDLADIRYQPYTTLSGGEKQRTHIARVLAQLWPGHASGGKILMLDEPTTSLDIRHQHMLLKYLRTLADMGTCIVTILHDINLAAQYCNRVQLMSMGQIFVSGMPADVLSSDNIRSVFGIQSHRLNHPVTGNPVIIPGIEGV